MKLIEHLTPEEKKQLKAGVIGLTGESMNKTVLGLVDAAIRLYPNITEEQLKEIFPDSINPNAPIQFKSIYKPHGTVDYGVFKTKVEADYMRLKGFKFHETHFTGKYVLKLADGTEIFVCDKWEKKAGTFEAVIKRAGEYGIKLVKFTEKAHFRENVYSIEILNKALYDRINNIGTVNAKDSGIKNKSSKSLIYSLIAAFIVVIGVIGYALFTPSDAGLIAEQPPEIELAQDPIEIEIEPVTVIEQLEKDISSGLTQETQSYNFNDILFDYNSSNINQESFVLLNKIAEIILKNESIQLLIIGHTSNEGSAEYNLTLSEARAKSVENYLVTQGVPVSSLKSKGEGVLNPVAPNDTEENRRLNRRIEFKISQ
ncbi:MAG: OmpA family protein [Luteibaculaceae bacterium]